MKKNTKKNELDQKSFTDHLLSYFRELENVQIQSSQESTFDRYSFGWALYLSLDKSRLTVVVVEPRHKYKNEFSEFIRFTENLGMLKIRIRKGDVNQIFERECHQSLALSRQIREYFSSLSSCAKEVSQISRLKAAGLIQVICSMFTDLIFEAPHLDGYFSDSKRQIMIKINSSLEGRLGTSFSAQDIVGDLGYSVQYLNKACREFRDLTLNNYLNLAKLENFRRQLINSKDKVSDLAERNGFSDVNYFIQLFKRTYKITPHQLRKKLFQSSPEERQQLNFTVGFKELNEVDRPQQISQLSLMDKRSSLIVANLSEEALELYWLSPEGEEVPMTLLDGLDRINVGSVEGHYWLIRRKGQSAFYRIGAYNCLIAF